MRRGGARFRSGAKRSYSFASKRGQSRWTEDDVNFVHAYGESGDTPPNLAFTRGESVEERRRALNEAKQRINALAEAAKSGNVWYVIALRKDNSEASDARRSPSSLLSDEGRSYASAVVLASVENRCITVSDFPALPRERVSEEMRTLLGEKGREASPADGSVARPQS